MTPTRIVWAGWLIDGSGAAVRRNALLHLAGDRIERLTDGPPAAYDLPRVIDFSEATLIPGLIDCHVHLCLSGTLDTEARRRQLAAGNSAHAQAIAQHIRRHLAHGVVAVRDGGDAGACVLRYKQRIPAGPLEVKSSGRAWHRAGRYGALIGRPLAADGDLAAAIAADPEDVDQVKIVNSGLNSLVVFGRQTPPQFEAGELRAAVAAAAGRGLPTMVHANGRRPVAAALAAGSTSIEHGFFMGAENLNRLAALRAFWVPTAVTMQAYAAALPPDDPARDTARRTLDDQVAALRTARDLGVRVVLGTDAGSPGVDHGAAVGAEMALLLHAGYTLPEAVACATGVAAELLGLAHGGCLAAGRDATFVVLPGPPENLPYSLARIRALYVGGHRAVVDS